jgi:Reeler domain
MKAIFLLFFSLVAHCLGRPDGAPALQSVCENLNPSHNGIIAQDTPSPYRIVVSSTSVKSGEIIDVEIQGEGRTFKGFFLLARTNEQEFQVLGEFLPDENEETSFNFRDCSGYTHNAVTHFNSELKDRISFKWRAPDIFDGSIHFR